MSDVYFRGGPTPLRPMMAIDQKSLSGTLTAPMVYTFIWLTIFGGAGIKEERQAAAQNLCCTNFDVSAMTNNTVVGTHIQLTHSTHTVNTQYTHSTHTVHTQGTRRE